MYDSCSYTLYFSGKEMMLQKFNIYCIHTLLLTQMTLQNLGMLFKSAKLKIEEIEMHHY